MNEIVIIIPSRLASSRLPDKPLKIINKKEMILHVYEAAVKAGIGEVYVATPDEKIQDVIESANGKVVKTLNDHETGTDRIFEIFEKTLNKEPNFIINLQGDMPNINSKDIKNLANYIMKKNCDIATLASNLKNDQEIDDKNTVKVSTKEKIKKNNFQQALDFFRLNAEKKKNLSYHHIGIYAFTSEALIKYVNLKRSNLELKRNLEQMRALENGMKIDVGFVESIPLSVDTEEDLFQIKKIMEKND